MRKFLWGLIIGLVAFPVLGAIYLLGGYAPAAVTDKPFPLEQYIAGAALESRIRRYAPKRDLSTFAAADIAAGAQVYRRGCGGCHGLPGDASNFPGPKMYPPPPHLFTPDGYVTDDPVGVTYWKIKNGIRMTAMPSFNGLLSDDQMWQVAALLASADKLPPGVLDVLKQPLFPPPPPSTSGSSPSPQGSAPSAKANPKK
ncbi:MAG TPA: cytochrome c [Candidatus Acidoferrales bacterium]|nr:cytochrome c [Candidatus Acidoferrales bacterium]